VTFNLKWITEYVGYVEVHCKKSVDHKFMQQIWKKVLYLFQTICQHQMILIQRKSGENDRKFQISNQLGEVN